MKFCFGDIVVINGDEIGVVVKSWERSDENDEPHHDVYCRMTRNIQSFRESEMRRYMIRHKYLDERELKINTKISD